MTTRKITFRLRRYNPDVDPDPRWETHELDIAEGMTVLEALQAIKRTHDPTLAWRSSCRMGICGSCGLFINGLPRLSCQTQVHHLQADVVEVSPLPNYPIIKDLVPDLDPMFAKHQAIRPYLIPSHAQDDTQAPAGEFLQTPDEREAYSQFSICIKCGLCLSACPTLATDPGFLGPQALAQAYRYTSDSRDAGARERMEAIDGQGGPPNCHLAGACTVACPKGVDPALGIQLLRRAMSLEALGLRRRRQPAQVVPLPTDHRPSDKIPQPPAHTVD